VAIQNPLGPRLGGSSSALGLNTPTLIKASSGTFWNINVNNIGSSVGYLCDSATIAGASPANAILTIPPAGVGTPNYDIPGAGPFPFFNGLVFLPGSADLDVNIAFS
jgi:hypothetical protein